MRLIDADELIEHKFKSASERMDLSVAYMGGWNDAIDSINENAPTIEAEPVRHGKWIIEDKYTDYRTERCSMCGWVANRDYIQDKWFYCPNCGAKMDLEE